MKSQNHRAAFYFCASILLLLLAIAVIPASAQSGGLNVLSISQVDYSWSNKVQEDAWILLVKQSSPSERIHVVINKEDIKGKDPISGEQGFATHDIEISMQTLSTTCNYPIKLQEGEYIYGVNLYKAVCDFSYNPLNWGVRCNWNNSAKDVDTWQQLCEASDGIFRANKDYWMELESGAEVSCFYLTPVGTHGVLQTPTYDFATEVSVTKKGDTQDTISAVISDREIETDVGTGAKSSYLGSYGYIEWVGNLVTGGSCPETAVIPYATLIQDSSRWELTSRRGYEDYRGHYQSGWGSCLNDIQNKNSEPEVCRDKLNQFKDNALQSEILTDPVVISTNIDGSIVKANIKPGAVQSPTYKLILSASWLGIYVPKPEPTIGNTKSEWDASTSQGKFWVDIKNVGDEGGDFTYGMTCQYPAQVREPDRSDYWNKDQVKTVELSVTGAVSEETIATCTVHVYDTKYPDIRKEKKVQITVIPPPTPKPTSITTPTPAKTSTPTSPPINGDGTPFTLLYAILGLLFTGVIAAALLWRRGRRGSGTEATKTPESENEQEEDVEKKRPTSSSTKWLATIIILIVILGGSGVFILSSLKPPEVSVESVSIKGFESIDLIIVAVPT